jgi:hypothetical protein
MVHKHDTMMAALGCHCLAGLDEHALEQGVRVDPGDCIMLPLMSLNAIEETSCRVPSDGGGACHSLHGMPLQHVGLSLMLDPVADALGPRLLLGHLTFALEEEPLHWQDLDLAGVPL